MVKSIFLQDGEEIFVDDEDYERVSQYTWWKDYVGNTRVVRATVKGKRISLKTFIKKGSSQKCKGNDFTRSNLTTIGNSSRWEKAKSSNSSKYKGVSWNKKGKKWQVSLMLDGKLKYLGQYSNEDEAGRTYNKGVLDYLDGEAYLNVIGEDNRNNIRDYKTYENQKRTRSGKHRYRGLSEKKNGFQSAIPFRKKYNYIGTFSTTHHAALTYNKCAIYLHGDDAILNDVPMTDELKAFIENWEIPKKILDLKK